MSIHSTAIVSPKAELGERVTIGPYAIVEEDTRIGDDTVLDANAQVRRGSTLGKENRVGSGVLIGADPQFLEFDPSTPTKTLLGDGNILREYVTIHRSSGDDGGTVVGNRNYLMTGAHVGHDCSIGNENTFANNVLLGGHVTVGDHCFLGGASVFHQFVRVGDYVLAQGLAGVSLDLPPYVIAAGINQVAGINSVGLRRAGFDGATRKQIKELFRCVYRTEQTIREVLDNSPTPHPEAPLESFLAFLRSPSKKGICVRFGNP